MVTDPAKIAPDAPPAGNGASPKRLSPFAEVGSSGLKRFGGELQEEFDPALRGPRGVRVFDEMRRNDPDVGAVLFSIKHTALAASWDTEPASDAAPDEEAAEFLSTCLFEDMSHSWADFIADAMTSNPFGWALFETVFKQRLGVDADPPSLYDDGRIGLRKLGMRGQETLLRWEFDEHGGIRGMWQRAWPALEPRFIPIAKALLIRTSSEKNNPEGVSLLRNSYRPYYIKTNIEEIEVIGAERDMTGVLVINLPANATETDYNKAVDMGRAYRNDDQAYIILQRFGEEDHENWTVDTLKSPGAKVVDTDKTIQRCSIHIMRATLAQFLTLGAGRTGSFALGRAQQDLFHLAVKGLLDTHEETINRFLVPKLFALNDFPGITGLPKVRHSDLGDVQLPELTALLDVMTKNSLLAPTPEVIAHLHERAGLPPPPDDFAFPEEETDDEIDPEEDESRDDAPEPGRMPKSAREWGRWYLR